MSEETEMDLQNAISDDMANISVGSRGAHLKIRLDGERRIGAYHPTWLIEYVASARPAESACVCGHPLDAHEIGYACAGKNAITADVAEWCQCEQYRPTPAGA